MRLLIAVGAVIGLLGFALEGPSAAIAKGDNYIVALTVSGGALNAPRTVSFAMPPNYDDMFETQAPATGIAGLSYDVVIHYDFKEYGGKRNWVGKFDGTGLLYFPKSMIVGPGVWAAGWYGASPPLVEGLLRAMSATALPTTGSGHRQSGWPEPAAWLVGMGVLLLTLGGTLAVGRGSTFTMRLPRR